LKRLPAEGCRARTRYPAKEKGATSAPFRRRLGKAVELPVAGRASATRAAAALTALACLIAALTTLAALTAASRLIGLAALALPAHAAALTALTAAAGLIALPALPLALASTLACTLTALLPVTILIVVHEATPVDAKAQALAWSNQ
jgi:hypothetical protein